MDSNVSNKGPWFFQPAAAILGSSCGCYINREAAKIQGFLSRFQQKNAGRVKSSRPGFSVPSLCMVLAKWLKLFLSTVNTMLSPKPHLRLARGGWPCPGISCSYKADANRPPCHSSMWCLRQCLRTWPQHQALLGNLTLECFVRRETGSRETVTCPLELCLPVPTLETSLKCRSDFICRHIWYI